MIKDIRKTEFGIEGKLYSKVFNTEMEVMIDEGVNIEYAQKCAEHFNSLNSELVETICKGAKAYCLDFMEMALGNFDEELTIPVTSENKIGYQLECCCDWEIEHGMEIDILDNKVVYLSSFNGYSPWLEYDTDEYNYINQI